MLSEGISSRRGRAGAFVHRDQIHGVLRGRRGARLAAITSGGAIPDTADYDVIEEPQGTFVGKVNEDFAIESQGGDIFLLGNTSWRIRRVEAGKVRVENAHGAPPSVPFWLGEAPARTAELSQAVSALRQAVADRLGDRESVTQWLIAETGVDRAGAEQIVAYVAETVAILGCVPTAQTIVAERFFDEAGGMPGQPLRPRHPARPSAGQRDDRQLPVRGDGSRRAVGDRWTTRARRAAHRCGGDSQPLAHVPRDPERQSLRLPGRCPAGRTPGPRGGAAPYRPGSGARPGRPGSGGDRRGAPAGSAGCPRRRRAARSPPVRGAAAGGGGRSLETVRRSSDRRRSRDGGRLA